MRYVNRTATAVICAAVLMFMGCDSADTDTPEPIADAPAIDVSIQDTVDQAADTMEALSPVEVSKSAAVPEEAPLVGGGEKVTVYRDEWGVPHIYSDTDRGAAYGLGYAQAEDRLDDIYIALRTGLGKMSEVFGSDTVQQDYVMRLLKNEELAQEYWDAAPAHLTELGNAYVDGVHAYIAENPGPKPEWAIDIEPWMLTTIGRAMILNWPLGTVQDELEQRDKSPIDGGSNQWAVSPSRSADGSAILLTDPHLTWEGLSVFYEARVHGDKLHMNGFFLMGSPLLAFGHTNNVGWAPTTGGPDTADVYEMTMNPDNPMQYEYDGEFKTAQISMISFPVKDSEDYSQLSAWTDLGPVLDIDQENGKAWVGASPYWKKMGLLEEIYQLCTAQNTDEVYKALSTLELMEQNYMFADRTGNIRYVRIGASPIRPEGFDFTRPVPGNTSETAWKGIHSIDDLVQLQNPASGYFQNCNISPANMMVDSPLTADKFIDYLYNVSWDSNNPRSRRIVALLDADDSVTREEAIDYVLNVYDILAEPWQNALRGAIERHGEAHADNADFQVVIEAILAWDGMFTPGSTGTPFLKNWRLKCGSSGTVEDNAIDVAAISAGTALSSDDEVTMLQLLADTIGEMKALYGTIELTWGDVHKVGRGGQYFPSYGADFGGRTDGVNFTETLFDVRYSKDKDDPKRYIADNGSMATMLMFFREDGVESMSVVPWGQNGNPESPHYMDQGEKLYSQRKMKPTWWTRESLDGHIESEKVLTLP
jgi:acyl-homoserine lactone acylase PvdQ